MPIGGGKFTLEKTWKTSAPSTSTFNNPSNVSFPYGKFLAYVTGTGGSGNPNVPGNAYYNPGSGGNAYYNPDSGGNVYYNPGSGGNAYYNPDSPGTAYYNPSTPGTAYYNTFYYRYIETFASNFDTVNSVYYSFFRTDYLFDATFIPCLSPQSGYNSYYRISYVNSYNCSPLGTGPGNYAGTNPPSPGNYAGTNPYVPGNYAGTNPYVPGNYAGTNPYVPGNYAGTNPTTPGNPGTSSFALGVTMSGGGVGSSGTYVAPTLADRYVYPDSATYPITVGSGGYVTVEVS